MSDFVCLSYDFASAWLAHGLRHPHAPTEEQCFFPRAVGYSGYTRYSSVYERRRGTSSFYGPQQKELEGGTSLLLASEFLFGDGRCRYRGWDRCCHLGGGSSRSRRYAHYRRIDRLYGLSRLPLWNHRLHRPGVRLNSRSQGESAKGVRNPGGRRRAQRRLQRVFKRRSQGGSCLEQRLFPL